MVILAAQRSYAEEWRYCLAPDNASRTVYISQVRAAQNDRADMEAQFGRMLDEANRVHDDVQCPRAQDEAAARAMRRHAIHFNQKFGRKVIFIGMP